MLSLIDSQKLTLSLWIFIPAMLYLGGQPARVQPARGSHQENPDAFMSSRCRLLLRGERSSAQLGWPFLPTATDPGATGRGRQVHGAGMDSK